MRSIPRAHLPKASPSSLHTRLPAMQRRDSVVCVMVCHCRCQPHLTSLASEFGTARRRHPDRCADAAIVLSKNARRPGELDLDRGIARSRGAHHGAHSSTVLHSTLVVNARVLPRDELPSRPAEEKQDTAAPPPLPHIEREREGEGLHIPWGGKSLSFCSNSKSCIITGVPQQSVSNGEGRAGARRLAATRSCRHGTA